MHVTFRRVEPVAVEQTGDSLAFTKLKDLNEFVGYWEGKGKMPESDNLSESGAKWAGMPIVVKRHVFWGPGMSSQIVNQVWRSREKYPFDRLQSRAGIPMKRRSSSTSIPRIWVLHCDHREERRYLIMPYEGFNLDGANCTGIVEVVPTEDGFMETEKNCKVKGKPIPDLMIEFQRVNLLTDESTHGDHMAAFACFIGDWESVKKEDGS